MQVYAGKAFRAEQLVDVASVVAHLRRTRKARGIGKPHLIATRLDELSGHLQHLALGHLTFDGAAESRRQRALEMRPVALRQRIDCIADRAYVIQYLCVGPAQILEAVRFAHRQRNGDLVRLYRQRILSATQIWNQHSHRQLWNTAGVSYQLGGIGKLRKQLGWHKRADLNLRNPRRSQCGNPCFFIGRCHDRADTLQAIARAHFADFNIHSVSLLRTAARLSSQASRSMSMIGN